MLLIFSTALVAHKVMLAVVLARDMMLLRMTLVTVTFPGVLSLEFVFIRELVGLAKMKSELLRRGNLCLSLGGYGLESAGKKDVESDGESMDRPDSGKSIVSSCSTDVQPEGCESPSDSSSFGFGKDKSTVCEEGINEVAPPQKAATQILNHKDSLEDLEKRYLGRSSI